MLLRRHLHKVLARALRPPALRHRANRAHDGNDEREDGVGHVQNPLPLGRAPGPRGVPPLPVLPRGVHGRAAGLVAPGAVRGAQLGVGRGVAAGGRPAQAVRVVEVALMRTGEDIVGGDDEAVAFEADGRGHGVFRGSGGDVVDAVDVGVVELHELVEAFLRIGFLTRDGEDVVGCCLRGRWPGRRSLVVILAVGRGTPRGAKSRSISSSYAMLRVDMAHGAPSRWSIPRRSREGRH